jgi:hypothetical protein
MPPIPEFLPYQFDLCDSGMFLVSLARMQPKLRLAVPSVEVATWSWAIPFRVRNIIGFRDSFAVERPPCC